MSTRLGPNSYVGSEQIKELAIEIYKRNGKRGITYADLIQHGLSLHKIQAQGTLKYHLRNGTLFTLEDKRPQQYYATAIKSVIMENRQKSIRIDPTGVTMSTPFNISKSPLSNCMELVIVQSLEGYILPLLQTIPPYIHNMHFKTKINVECYAEENIQELSEAHGNRGKQLFEIIGNSRVTYTFYPSGTINIEVKCSSTPFKLENELDYTHILLFFGQLRDRLITFLNDPRERIVPDITEWYLMECDINRDVKVSDWLHYTGIKIKIKHFNHLFQIYIKAMGKDTVCRVEERKQTNGPAIEIINNEFNPYEKFEKRLDAQDKLLHQILDKLRK